MARLILVEQPLYYAVVKECGLIPGDADVVSLCAFQPWRARLPENPGIASAPFTPAPAFDLPHRSNRKDVQPLLQDGRQSTPSRSEQKDWGMSELIDRLGARWPEYEEIMVAVSKHPASQWNARQLLDHLAVTPMVPVRTVWHDERRDRPYLTQAWEGARTDNPRASNMVRYGRLKSAFDYWWACNARSTLSDLIHACALDPAPIPSHGELLALDRIARQSPTQLTEDLKRMLQCREEGDYHPTRADPAAAPASLFAILKNLVHRGAIALSGDGIPSTTRKGRQLLSGLHPDTIDPGLGKQLHAWCQQGNEMAIARCIRDVFQKQKKATLHTMGQFTGAVRGPSAEHESLVAKAGHWTPPRHQPGRTRQPEQGMAKQEAPEQELS